jgi:hypothetical protein
LWTCQASCQARTRSTRGSSGMEPSCCTRMQRQRCPSWL